MANPFDKYDEPASTGNPFDRYDEPAKASKPEATAASRVRAAVAGVNKGFFANLAGLPVDTVANVIDLAKAGIGTATTAFGRPDLAPDIADRANVVGSSEWLVKKANEHGLGDAVNNPNPEDKLSRILHMGGQGAGMSVVPSRAAPAALQLANMAKGGVSGLAAGTVGESNPEWAGLAGMAPQVLGMAGPAAVRGAIRGGEAGRQAMNARMATLREGGVETPSVGLATGNGFISGLENLLSQTPGSMGLFERARNRNVAGMQAKTEGVRDAVSPEYGPVAAGAAIQNDLKGTFRQRTSDTAKKLGDRVAALIGHGTTVPVDNTLATAGRLSTPTPGAENTTGALINPRIAAIAENLRSDVYGAQPQPSRPLAGNPTLNLPSTAPEANPALWNAQQRTVSNPALMNVPTEPVNPLPQRAQNVGREQMPFASLMNTQKQQGIPFGALKSLRTSIGDETQSSAIMGTPEQKQFKALYASLSDDMRRAADASDRTQAGAAVGPLMRDEQPATNALNRANRHFSTALTRAEELEGLAKRDTPEGAYGAVANSLKAGPTIYERLRSAVTPATRQKVVATVIDELGQATDGHQNAEGSVWSPRTFLTNYNRVDPQARDALFTRLPGGATHAANLAKVAKTAELLGDGAKVWSNPSGTSQALLARGTIGTIGLGIAGGLFYTPLIAPAAVAAGGLGLAHQTSQRLLLNPKFVNWLAKAPPVKTPEQMQAYAQRLLVAASMTNDPQFKNDTKEYLDSIAQ